MIIIGLIGTILYYLGIVSLFLIMTPIAAVTWVLTVPFDRQRRLNHALNSFTGKMILWLNPFWKVKFHISDKIDRKETYVIASNHQSLLDIPALASAPLQFKFVSKKELSYIPFLGWTMSMANYILLNRKDPKSQFKMMRNCENYLKNGMSIGLYPEGTRSGKEELGRFKDGASLLAQKTGRRIVPVCMSGNSRCLPEKGFIWTKRININMYMLDPIDPADYEKTKDITVAIKDAISKQLASVK